MPSIDDYNPSDYDKGPVRGKKPVASPSPAPAQPAASGGGRIGEIVDLISRLPQLQAGLAAGGVKELGRQATNAGQFTGSIPPAIQALIPGGAPAMLASRVFPAVQRAILPPEQTQASFEPEGGAQQAGALATRVAVPIAAGAATAGAVPLAGLGAGARIGATAGLEGVTGAATGAAQGDNPLEQGALAALLGGAGAGVGAAVGAGKAAMAASAARKARNAGSPTQQANEALGVALKHVKDGQMPARFVTDHGVNLKAPPEMIDEQITLAIDKAVEAKERLARQLPAVAREEVDKVVERYGDNIAALIKKAYKINPETAGEKTLHLQVLSEPGPASQLDLDKARGELRGLIEELAAGNKKKGLRKTLEEARKMMADLTPALKAGNRDIADGIAARLAIRDKIKKLGIEGLPEQEPSTLKQITTLLGRALPFGKAGAAARAVNRVIPD